MNPSSKTAITEFHDLEDVAASIRGTLVEMSHRAQTNHLGGALSCVDILVTAYSHVLRIDPQQPMAPDRDRFILSKGHAISAHYAVLSSYGFIDPSLLETYNVVGGQLAEQPSPGCVPGLEAATGSLGHGLGLGIGMALAGRIRKHDYRVMVLMSDGECNEGSVWEAAMFAPAHGLDNLMVIIDFNKWQATGRSHEIMALDPLKAKWAAFGWSACEVDGHDFTELTDVMSRFPDGSGKPIALIAHTIKGKGVSFMEDDNNWHYRSPTTDEVEMAKAELGLT